MVPGLGFHHLPIEGGLLLDLDGAPVPDLFVGGAGDVDGVLQLAGLETLGSGQHAGHRPLHVAGPSSVEPSLPNGGHKRSVILGEPVDGRHHVGVPEIGHSAPPLSLFPHHAGLADPILVLVLQAFGLTAHLLQTFLQVVGQGHVAEAAGGVEGDDVLGVLEGVHESVLSVDDVRGIPAEGIVYNRRMPASILIPSYLRSRPGRSLPSQPSLTWRATSSSTGVLPPSGVVSRARY